MPPRSWTPPKPRRVFGVRCHECKKFLIEATDTFDVGHKLCRACYQTRYFQCDLCGHNLSVQVRKLVELNPEERETWCRTCCAIHGFVYTCTHCGAYTRTRHLLPDGHGHVCGTCLHDYFTCAACGALKNTQTEVCPCGSTQTAVPAEEQGG